MKISVNWTSVDAKRHTTDYTTILRMLTGDMGGSPLAGLRDALERCRFLIAEIEDFCYRSLHEEVTSAFNSYGDIVVHYAAPGQEISPHENRWLFFVEDNCLVKNNRDFGPLNLLEVYFAIVLQAQTELWAFTDNRINEGRSVHSNATWSRRYKGKRIINVRKLRHFHENLDIPMKSIRSLMTDFRKLKRCREMVSRVLCYVNIFYHCLQWLDKLQENKPIRLDFCDGVPTDIFQFKDDKLSITVPLEANPDVENLIDRDIVAIGEELLRKDDCLLTCFDRLALKVSDFNGLWDFEFYWKAKHQGKTSLGGTASVYGEKLEFASFIREVVNCPNMAMRCLQRNTDIPDGLWCPALYEHVTNGKSFKHLLVRVRSNTYGDSELSFQFKIIDKFQIEELPTDLCSGIWYYISFEEFGDPDQYCESTIQLLSDRRSLYRWINADQVLGFFKSREICKQTTAFPINGGSKSQKAGNELVARSSGESSMMPLATLILHTTKRESLLILDEKLTRLTDDISVNLTIDWHGLMITGKQMKIKNLPYKAASALFHSVEQLKYDYFEASRDAVRLNGSTGCSIKEKFNRCMMTTIPKLNCLFFKSYQSTVGSVTDMTTLVEENMFRESVKIQSLSDTDLCISLLSVTNKTDVKPFIKSLELAFIKCFIKQEVFKWKSLLNSLLGRLSINVAIDLSLFSKQKRSSVVIQYEHCRDAFIEAFVNFCLVVPEVTTKLSDQMLNLNIKMDSTFSLKSQQGKRKATNLLNAVTFENGEMKVTGTPHTDVETFTQSLYHCFSLNRPAAVSGVEFVIDDIQYIESETCIRIVLQTSKLKTGELIHDVARILKNSLVVSIYLHMADRLVQGHVVLTEVQNREEIVVKVQTHNQNVKQKHFDVVVSIFGKIVLPALHRLPKGLKQHGCSPNPNSFDIEVETGGEFSMMVNHNYCPSVKFSADEDVFSRGVKPNRHQYRRAQVTFLVGENPVPVPIRLDKSYVLRVQRQTPTYYLGKNNVPQFTFCYICKFAGREVRLVALCMKCSSFLQIQLPSMKVPAGHCLVVNRKSL